MNDLINIYIKLGERWVYHEGCRMHKTLKAAEKHYLDEFKVKVKAKFANDRMPYVKHTKGVSK